MPRRKKPSMRYLVQGFESKEKIELLLSLTKIDSDNIHCALNDYFVRGFEMAEAAEINNVRHSNLSRAVDTLNRISGTVEKLFELKSVSLN